MTDSLLNQLTISLLYKCDDLHTFRELKMFCEQMLPSNTVAPLDQLDFVKSFKEVLLVLNLGGTFFWSSSLN